MLVATHDLKFARRFCDRFVMLAEGHIVAETTEVRRLVQGWDDL